MERTERFYKIDKLLNDRRTTPMDTLNFHPIPGEHSAGCWSNAASKATQ